MDGEDVAEYAEIFGALADETRLEVLLAIMERTGGEGPVTYSEAMDAADLDDSGHFNYHLGELTGNWLYPIGEQYAPTTAAWELYTTLRTGLLRDNDLDRRTEHLDVACMRCGEFLRAVYDYEFFVTCPGCERTPFYASAGPDVGDDADLPSLARELDDVDRRHKRLLLDGRCPDCAGAGVAWLGPSPAFAWTPTSVAANVCCSNCGNGYRFRTPGQYLLVAPEVHEYADAHDIDLDERPQWAYEWARCDHWTDVLQEEPFRIEQHATVDGCRLVAEIESDGSVTHLDHVALDGLDADAVVPGISRGAADAASTDRPAPDRPGVDE